MNVYKFGGASIASPDRMKALLPIISAAHKPLVLVVSAMGKTTNALEEIVNTACHGKKEVAMEKAVLMEEAHLAYAREVASGNLLSQLEKALSEHFTELHWAIDDAELSRYDYWYDQIVSIGELLSTRIISCMLCCEHNNAVWLDARDFIKTDDTWRDARVDWAFTERMARSCILPQIDNKMIVVTQGFIGATPDNASVTLGREGSDYTAAMLAAMLQAEGVTIWKDVSGLQNADPREFPDAVKIDQISYREVIEMAYYGAQVIHPKTIKPLQNAGIPLYVKCFLDKDLPGTVIKEDVPDADYPPLIICKRDQVLIQATTKDFSFITEDSLSTIYQIFAALNFKINLMQHAAISFVACLDSNSKKLSALIEALERHHRVLRNENAELLTIRHYKDGLKETIVGDRQILLEQRTRHTLQVVSVNHD